MGITQHRARFQRHLLQQPGGDFLIAMIGNGQFGGQRDPHRAHGDGQVQLPAIPPAMPARFAPARFRINRTVRNLAEFAVFLMPNAACRCQRRAIQADRTPLMPPRLEQDDEMSAAIANEAWQGARQFCQTTFPRAARGKPALFDEQWPELDDNGVVLLQKPQQRLGRIEPPNNHDDQGFQHQSIRVLPGASPRSFVGCRRPGQLINQFDQADKNAVSTYHLSASMGERFRH
jgi:hypothetical protein